MIPSPSACLHQDQDGYERLLGGHAQTTEARTPQLPDCLSPVGKGEMLCLSFQPFLCSDMHLLKHLLCIPDASPAASLWLRTGGSQSFASAWMMSLFHHKYPEYSCPKLSGILTPSCSGIQWEHWYVWEHAALLLEQQNNIPSNIT